MTLLLSNAVLWPLLLLAGLPILIHLFARTRPPSYRFSSVEFILKIMRKTMRIRRPQAWILLVLRTLLVLLLALLFLRPLLFGADRLGGMLQRKSVVVLVDASASMACPDGAQTRFASACAEASEILAGLSGGDRANVIWMKAAPDPVFPDMGVNLAYLRSELRRARVTDESANIGEAARMAAGMLDGAEGRREICIVSDFQSSAWRDADLPAVPGIDLVKIKTAGSVPGNRAVTAIYTEPAGALVHEDMNVYCDVHNYSETPSRTDVFLNIGENRQSQTLLISPWSKSTAVFRFRAPRPGMWPVAVSIGEDPYPADNRRWDVLNVSDTLRVGMAGADTATGRCWKRALDALGWVSVESVAADELGGDTRYDALMISEWSGKPESALRAALDRCSAVVWFPARDAVLPALLSANDGSRAVVMRWEESDTPFGARIESAGDRVFRIFAGGEYGDPGKGTFRGRLNFPATGLAGHDALMVYADGVPALLRFDGSGSLFLWNMPLDTDLSAWSRSVEFLPFVAELLLSARSRNRDTAGECVTGQAVTRIVGSHVVAGDLGLLNEDGARLPVTIKSAGARPIAASSVRPPPGLYSWLCGGTLLGYSVVNFPAIESDLRTMSVDEIKTAGAVTVGSGGDLRKLREGRDLWPLLLGLATLAAMTESAVLIWVARTKTA